MPGTVAKSTVSVPVRSPVRVTVNAAMPSSVVEASLTEKCAPVSTVSPHDVSEPVSPLEVSSTVRVQTPAASSPRKALSGCAGR